MNRPTPDQARRFIDDSDFLWHQVFELADDVSTPGVQSVIDLINIADLPTDLTGKSVLDIGTTNGGTAFALEARGASRVVAVDVVPPTHFGFEATRDFLGSRAEFVQESVYRLPWVLKEEFDLVIFTGVLYHLRHPLLALDALRDLTRGTGVIETAVCDWEVPDLADKPYGRFYRRDELGKDWSNWYAPTSRLLMDWCGSCGLDAEFKGGWPADAPQRAMAVYTRSAGEPEFMNGPEPRLDRLI